MVYLIRAIRSLLYWLSPEDAALEDIVVDLKDQLTRMVINQQTLVADLRSAIEVSDERYRALLTVQKRMQAVAVERDAIKTERAQTAPAPNASDKPGRRLLRERLNAKVARGIH